MCESALKNIIDVKMRSVPCRQYTGKVKVEAFAFG